MFMTFEIRFSRPSENAEWLGQASAFLCVFFFFLVSYDIKRHEQDIKFSIFCVYYNHNLTHLRGQFTDRGCKK